MQAFRRMLVGATVCLASLAIAQTEDSAARVLGPRWRQMCRDAGMIFSGTVLEVRSGRLGKPGQIPIVRVRFRVDHPIAGVQSRRSVTIREWAGAWSGHPMHPGERVLLLLYPQSRLGLTSPVGGSLGQVSLSNEDTVVRRALVPENDSSGELGRMRESDAGIRITLAQLERAIRSARGKGRPRSSHARVIGKED